MSTTTNNKKKDWKIVFTDDALNDCRRVFRTSLYWQVRGFFSDVKYGLKLAWQRARRGYDDSWFYNLHGEFLEALIPNLKRIKNEGGGTPYPFHTMEHGQLEWERTLQKMIDGFEMGLKLSNQEYLHNADSMSDKKVKALHKKWTREFNSAMKLLTKHYFSLWD